MTVATHPPASTTARTPPATALALHRAGVSLGGRRLWWDVDLRVDPGEFVVVLGQNGAGKTTLLRVLLGLLPLTAGRVEVMGRAPLQARPLIGYVPQHRSLDPDVRIRARDLVGLGVDGTRWGVEIRPSARRERRRRVDEALEAVGARDYADEPAGRLSGGEQQRLLLAQALVGGPDVLLLDEPLASLDLRSQGVVSALVGTLARERGITVVLVAHDVNPLAGVLDRVVYVAGGGMAAGRPEQVITTENLSRLYDHPVEVLRDSRGRLVVVGLEDGEAHHA